MTSELYHAFYKGFQNDPAIYMNMRRLSKYEYFREDVDRYFDEQQIASRRVFAIVVDGRIVGEYKLSYVYNDKKECSMGIHLPDDAVKGKGYEQRPVYQTSMICLY